MGTTYVSPEILTQGFTYAFKVQARNQVGYGDFSSEVSILAAQIPDQPEAPTTSISGDSVVVSWQLPDNRGSPITAYTVRVRESDSLTFTEDALNCGGTDQTIVLNRECSVPISVLRAAPFNLPWGSNIHAKVSAINAYGSSTESDAGNGAIMLT